MVIDRRARIDAMQSATDTRAVRAPDDEAAIATVATLFRVFGDPTRLATLELLRVGELPVQAIADELGLSQSSLSNHLACLRRCGCVTTRREHRRIFYSLASDRVAEMVALGRSLYRERAESIESCQRLDAEDALRSATSRAPRKSR